MRALFIVGEPGVGKSSAVNALVEGCRVSKEMLGKLKATAYRRGRGPVVFELGWRQGGFPGTDTLPMDASKQAEAEVARHRPPLLLVEGDRLSNSPFATSLLRAGYVLDVVELIVSPAEAARRRAARGSNQDEAWVNGRRTKSRAFREAFGGVAVEVDGLSPAEVAAALRPRSPVAHALVNASPAVH